MITWKNTRWVRLPLIQVLSKLCDIFYALADGTNHLINLLCEK